MFNNILETVRGQASILGFPFRRRRLMDRG